MPLVPGSGVSSLSSIIRSSPSTQQCDSLDLSQSCDVASAAAAFDSRKQPLVGEIVSGRRS